AVLAQPRMQFAAGKEAKMMTGGQLAGDAEDEYTFEMQVFVEPSGASAKYSATVTIGGEVVSQQTTRFALR
ncbi:MAG: hypothetical protein AAGH19_06795, partial [Pseudomonadota bacterium]